MTCSLYEQRNIKVKDLCTMKDKENTSIEKNFRFSERTKTERVCTIYQFVNFSLFIQRTLINSLFAKVQSLKLQYSMFNISFFLFFLFNLIDLKWILNQIVLKEGYYILNVYVAFYHYWKIHFSSPAK